jgi:CPA2 family monovalent cation:H+ antiporter-2
VAVPPSGKAEDLDLGWQPRVVLVAAVRMVGILVVGSALIAITQPFLPGYTAAAVLLIAIVVLAMLFWRTVGGLHGHMRAAAQVVVEALASQTRSRDVEHAGVDDPLAQARTLFPGLGAPVRFDLPATSPAVGRSLAQLELRATTGATVLAIVRGSTAIAVPDAHDPLHAGDVLAIAGTEHAIDSAIALLAGELPVEGVSAPHAAPPRRAQMEK